MQKFDDGAAGEEGAVDRQFTANDMARVACASCEGCGECCRGMGESILLDPYDAHQLAVGLGRPFAELLNREAGLIVDEGVILPYLAMREDTEACPFLRGDGRCGIHGFRPGICRLFPLARNYDGDRMTYFILERACERPGKSKVRISRWLGIPDLREYEAFKRKWHEFVRRMQDRLGRETDEAYGKQINMYLLQNFYLKPYDGDSFYALFEMRLAQAEKIM